MANSLRNNLRAFSYVICPKANERMMMVVV